MTNWPVDLVLYDEGHTSLVKAEIECSSPLRLRVLDGKGAAIRPARRVMLLANHEDLVMRADGHLDDVARDTEGTHLEISQVHWELLERRRHVRVPVSVPVGLRSVVEGENEPAELLWGTTVDISISGALIQISPLPPEGTLIEFQAVLNGETIQVLSVVARAAGPGTGVGIHFVEYIDNSRFLLHEFLTQAA